MDRVSFLGSDVVRFRFAFHVLFHVPRVYRDDKIAKRKMSLQQTCAHVRLLHNASLFCSRAVHLSDYKTSRGEYLKYVLLILIFFFVYPQRYAAFWFSPREISLFIHFETSLHFHRKSIYDVEDEYSDNSISVHITMFTNIKRNISREWSPWRIHLFLRFRSFPEGPFCFDAVSRNRIVEQA